MGEDAPKGLATHRLRNMHVYESVGYSHNGSTHLAHRFVGCWPQVRNALALNDILIAGHLPLGGGDAYL